MDSRRGIACGCVAVLAIAACSQPGRAQSAEWNNCIGLPGLNESANSLAVFDDGSGVGPLLYVGGSFVGAGDPLITGLAKWNGLTWSGVSAGIDSLLVVAALDAGDGLALYIGGAVVPVSGHIAKWNGKTWTGFGTGVNNSPAALMVFDDDGPGPHPSALYTGGYFTVAGGMTVNRVAKWDGSTWSSLGTGVSGTDAHVASLAVFDDDADGPNLPALYAGGTFNSAGGLNALNIARWDGKSWSALGTGMNGQVFALATFDDDGPGPHPNALYAGGFFTMAGGAPAQGIAKWDGTAWSGVGGGVTTTVNALLVFDDGAGPALFAAGGFTTAGGVPAKNLAKWNGTGWTGYPDGPGPAGVFGLAGFDDGFGGGTSLYAAGSFNAVGGAISRRVAQLGRIGGACCLPDNSCQQLAPSDCRALSGRYQGHRTRCINVSCPGESVCVGDIAPAGAIDGQINVADLLRVINWWMLDPSGCTGCNPDATGNCVVNLGDLLTVINNWGPCP